MFEMTSFRSDASTKPLPPLINSLIDDVLTKYRPNLNQTFSTVLGRPLPDFRIIVPVSFKCLIKSFKVLIFHSLVGNSFVSLIAP